MFPIKAEQLALTEIADYWAREIKPRATHAELLTTLEKAWFGGELMSVGRPTRLDLLRAVFKSTQADIVFLIGAEPGPPELQELEDGGALVDPRPRVKVPSSTPKNWTEEGCSEAFAVIADQWSPDWKIEVVKVYAPMAEVTHAEFHKWLGTRSFRPVTFWAQPKHSVDSSDLPVAPIGKLRNWYVNEYIPEMISAERTPSFQDDLEAAQKKFEGFKIPQRQFREEIRAKHAPESWKSPRKPKSKTPKI